MAHPVVIAAGGTGGHFFPAEALGAELVRRGHRIVLFTDARRANIASPVFDGRERFIIKGAGIAGRGVLRSVSAAAGLAAGTLQARGVLAGLGAAAVVGFGGYPSVAPVLATRLLRRPPPVLLHEQNAVLGRANRRLVPFADLLALSFLATAGVPGIAPAQVTGNPVRPELAGLAGQGYAVPEAEIRLLVLGGSLGARVFSDVVPAALAALPAMLRARLRVTQQCRAEDIERVREAYAAHSIHADLAPFFADVAGMLGRAHLVIARAGASTVAELSVAGRPAILVPLPHAIDDHQTANAAALAKAGGGWIAPQSGFTAEALAGQLAALFEHPAVLAEAAARAATLGRPDAAARLADRVEAAIAVRQEQSA
jgi:UDP-N-acetylglucosamine--N-acetylmuramyl-(pentapeptide) pyrophosphoryl-undecaprenol N-acetylglucosamine transferase